MNSRMWMGIFFIGLALSQAPSIEELEKQAQIGDPGGRAKAMNSLSKKFRRTDPQKSLDYARKAMALWEEIGDPARLGESLNNAAIVLYLRQDFEESFALFSRAHDIFKPMKGVREAGVTLKGMGDLMLHLHGDTEKAMDYYQRALDLFEFLSEEKGATMIHNALGNLKKGVHDFEGALFHFEKARGLLEKGGNQRHLAYVLGNLSDVLAYLPFELDRALEFNLQSLRICESLGDMDCQGNRLNGVAMILESMGYAEMALEYFECSYDYQCQAGSVRDQITTLVNSAATLNTLGRPEEALPKLDLAKQRIPLTGKFQDLNYRIDRIYSESRELLGDYYAALVHFRSFYRTKYDLINEQRNQQIAEMEARHKADRQRQQNEILRKDIEIQKITIKKQSILVFFLVTLTALIALAASVFGRRIVASMKYWRASHYVGHFRILNKLGKGGAGTVYQARNMVDSREVALKVLDDHLVDPTMRKRFIQEGLMNEHLDHPNVIRIFEKGEYRNRLYYAMELVNGETLRDLMDRRALSPTVATCIFINLLDIIHDIHEAGIIHRDIKPENVMLTKGKSVKETALSQETLANLKGRIKILDFGLARIVDTKSMTKTDMLGGTLHYLAPEYLLGKKARDRHFDFYSLGVVLYEMYCSRMPFPAEDILETLSHIMLENPKAPYLVNPELPRVGSDLALALIAKKPSQRLKTYEAIRSAAMKVLHSLTPQLDSEETGSAR